MKTTIPERVIPLELRQLQYFYTVAKYENFSKAADELFIAQSALSKSIAKLEEELNLQLFIRTSKNVRLSPAGQELQSYLRTILPAVNSIGPHLHDFVSNHVEACTVSVLASMSTISEVLADYSRAFPSAKLVLTRSEDPSQFDVKFVFGTPNFEKEDTLLLRDQEIYLLVSRKSPLAKEKRLRLADLEGYPYVENITTHNFKHTMRSLFEELNPSFDVLPKISVGSYNLLCYLVEQDLGYTFSPDIPNLLNRYDIALIPMENHAMRCPLYLTWDKNKYLSRAAKNFIFYTCDYFGVTPTGLDLSDL